MYSETVDHFADLCITKINFLRTNFLGYIIASMLAGIYVGFGIVLIFSIGAPLAGADSPSLKLVMGASFGIALTLVMFAGSELFTGNTMLMAIGLAKKTVNVTNIAYIWLVSWIGNLLGSLLLAGAIVLGGSITHSLAFFSKVATAKMSAPPEELFIRAIMCNMLVCLAIWTSARAKSDTAKIFLIFWCLFAFIGAGFEHSIANMTLLGVAILGSGGTEVLNWGGFFYNLFWVTFGNIIGGSVFIGLAYVAASKKPQSA